ncbi:MAG: hypothetical protein ACPG30_02815 [Parvibaculales bacterium]
MTRLHMPAPVIVHALRRDIDLPHQDRCRCDAQRHADLAFEIWHRGDEQSLSDFMRSSFIVGALGQSG